MRIYVPKIMTRIYI